MRDRELTQLTNVLVRLAQIRHGQKHGKDQSQGPAQRGGVARPLGFRSGAPCIVQRLVEQAPVQERTCHADEQEARIMKEIWFGSRARSGRQVPETRFRNAVVWRGDFPTDVRKPPALLPPAPCRRDSPFPKPVSCSGWRSRSHPGCPWSRCEYMKSPLRTRSSWARSPCSIAISSAFAKAVRTR